MPLNPNAPTFSFNPSAAAFVPGQSFAAPAAAPAATPAPAAPAAATPASEPAQTAPVSNTNGLGAKWKTDAPTFVPGGFSGDSAKPPAEGEAKAASAESKAQDTAAAPAASGKSWASLAAKKEEEAKKVEEAKQAAAPKENGKTSSSEVPKSAAPSGESSAAKAPAAPAAAPAPAAPAAAQNNGSALSDEQKLLELKRPSNLQVQEKSSEQPAAAAHALKDAPVHPLKGATYDMKALLTMRKDATPVDVLQSTVDGFQKTLEDTPELDPSKDMPSRTGDSSTPRGLRRQDSGTPRTPKSGRGKNDVPLRDRTGKIIEVKALEVSESRWKPGKPTDDEEVVYKKIKGLLNKLTLEKFDKLYAELLSIGITTASLMKGFVVILYDKAVLEPTFIRMYSQMCERLAKDLPEMNDDDGVIPFADVLIGKCRAEFELIGAEGEAAQLEGLEGDEREQKLRKLKQRTLGNVEFIGELFKKKMVGAEEVDVSITKMLDIAKDDSEAIQPLCKLLEGVGKVMQDLDKAQMDGYFGRMDELAQSEKLSSRFRFMLLDLKDMRSNGWVPRRAAAGPQMLEDVQKEVDKENRFTEKKKEPEKDKQAKNQGQRGSKADKKGGRDKKNKEAEDDGWSQVTTVVKGKGKNDKGKGKQEVAAPSTPKRGQPVKATAQPSRGGFAALMGMDDDDDDSDEDDSDEEEEKEEEGSEEEEEEEEEPKVVKKSKMELLSPEGENAIGSILEEYLCIHDTDEAVECLQELYGKGHPKELVNEEVVRKGLMLALDAGPEESLLIGKMFSSLLERKVLEGVDSAKGFCDVMADLADIAIDVPKAPQLMASIIEHLLEKRLLDKKVIGEGVQQVCDESEAMGKHFEAVKALLAQ